MSVPLHAIAAALEKHAPIGLQESYDNVGLLIGSRNDLIEKALLCLEITEDVLMEAREKKCNLIISHHPLIFGGIKKITREHYQGRIISDCLRYGINVYAAHTNLDNVKQGVSNIMATRLGLKNCQVLQPKEGYLNILVTYVPAEHLSKLQDALFNAGAGKIGNYSECAFRVDGRGSFKPGEGAQPFVGEVFQRHEEKEIRLEMVFPKVMASQIVKALKENHPYEEVAFQIIPTHNSHPEQGSGLIGTLENPIEWTQFLQLVKEKLNTQVIKYTHYGKNSVQKVAVCGGAGSFLLKDALKAGADVFITGDLKHHDYFETTEQMMVCDIGHYESEQFTPELLLHILSTELPTFAAQISQTDTNPINYFI